MKKILLGLVLGFLVADAWWVYRRAPELIQREIARVFREQPAAPLDRLAVELAEALALADGDQEAGLLAIYTAADTALHRLGHPLGAEAQDFCDDLAERASRIIVRQVVGRPASARPAPGAPASPRGPESPAAR